jgi:hypothetical protein
MTPSAQAWTQFDMSTLEEKIVPIYKNTRDFFIEDSFIVGLQTSVLFAFHTHRRKGQNH